jgi:ABC-2 type transport system ATP-binding protein
LCPLNSTWHRLALGCDTITGYSIETEDLTKRFILHRGLVDFLASPLKCDEFTSLNSVNLKVKEGEVFGLIGPNGAGKTTLIKILCTLITPTSGWAYVNGHDVVDESSEVRRSIGFVTTDERSFYWRLTGRQNLEFFAALHNFSTQKARDRVNELLATMNLSDKADELFMGYSAGMKQRMAIARGLLNEPSVLFMDEPTRSLDPGAARNLRDLIKNYIVNEQGKTVFLSSHNLEEVEQLCHRIAIFDRGEVKVAGAVDELKAGIGSGTTLSDVFMSFTGTNLSEDMFIKPHIERRHRHGGGFGRRG